MNSDVHREDCGGYGACECRAADEPPAREPRIVEPEPDPGPPPIHLPIHGQMAERLAELGIDLANVVNLQLTVESDELFVLHADVARTDPQANHLRDDHGKQITYVVDIPLTVTPPSPDGAPA